MDMRPLRAATLAASVALVLWVAFDASTTVGRLTLAAVLFALFALTVPDSPDERTPSE